MIDPEINWSPSESFLLQNTIVSYGRRATGTLKRASPTNEDVQRCLNRIKEQLKTHP